MPRLFLSPEVIAGPRVTITGDAHRHLFKVLRLAEGDEVIVFDGQGTEIAARIVAVGARSAELALGERRAVPVAKARVTLLQALPRGDRMEMIVQKATELGVARLVPVQAARTLVRPPPQRVERWRAIAREAARQCGRADLPELDAPRAFDEALADAVGTRLLLWEGESARPLARALAGDEQEVTLLVGPEGGWTEEEVRRASEAGFVSVGLGRRILRVETAAIAALAIVQAAIGALD